MLYLLVGAVRLKINGFLCCTAKKALDKRERPGKIRAVMGCPMALGNQPLKTQEVFIDGTLKTGKTDDRFQQGYVRQQLQHDGFAPGTNGKDGKRISGEGHMASRRRQEDRG